jgi:HEAT repeat protein
MRLRALDALAELTTPTARAAIEQALAHADERVREAAGEHLSDGGSAGP